MGMTKQFLHRAKFHAALKHQNSKGVPQHMWCDRGDTGLARIALDDQPEPLPRESFTMMIHE